MLGCRCHVSAHQPCVVFTSSRVINIKLTAKLTMRPDKRTGVPGSAHIFDSIVHLEFASPCNVSLPSHVAYRHHSKMRPTKGGESRYEMHVEGDTQHT